MMGVIVWLVVMAGVAYALKLTNIYIIERRRPDWDEERAQFKKDLARSVKISKRIARHYWKW